MPLSNERVVALLPMKANSVRVPNKNFRDFNGKPLFRWVLDTLQAVSEIDLIVINTDARSVLAEHGLLESERVRIRDRKPEICGDDVSMNLILADDLSDVTADTYLMTHTTNPLLSTKTIRSALNAFCEAQHSSQIDSLFTVNRFQSRFYRQDASALNHDPQNLVKTQDLEPWFEENSNLYLFTAESFAKTKARIGATPMLFDTPRIEAVDIDTPNDWELAVLIAEAQARLIQTQRAGV